MKKVSTKNQIIKKLKEKKYRLTASRVAMLDIFQHSPHPLSASILFEMLDKAGIAINRSTIYRELDFLEKEKIIERIYLNKDKRTYDLVSEPSNYILCVHCGQIAKISKGKEEEKIIKRAHQETGYTIKKSSFNLFGLCPKCASKINTKK